MRRLHPVILIAALAFAAVLWQRHTPAPTPAGSAAKVTTSVQGRVFHAQKTAVTAPGFLPREARATVARIASGGPYEHRQDGAVFGNYEGLLPAQPRGYYHEYTVQTSGVRSRGARRIVTGGTPPVVWYYTDDHYRSFRRFELGR
ncbi:MAG: ribonuclease [Rhodanobacter sp.]|nr:MAG: ribonuclease [Rhodanobacter sp.]